MYLSSTLKSGVHAAIIVRSIATERLATKCFRGTSLARAGNFSRWSSAEKLFSDPLVMRHFLADLDLVLAEKDFRTHSVTITHDELVGWESTDALERYASSDLEAVNLNHKSWGLRVKPTRTNVLAPQTSDLTIVYEFKREGSVMVAIVHSIYPGCDIGELDGDVTAREGRVFFDWNHPGAT